MKKYAARINETNQIDENSSSFEEADETENGTDGSLDSSNLSLENSASTSTLTTDNPQNSGILTNNYNNNLVHVSNQNYGTRKAPTIPVSHLLYIDIFAV